MFIFKKILRIAMNEIFCCFFAAIELGDDKYITRKSHRTLFFQKYHIKALKKIRMHFCIMSKFDKKVCNCSNFLIPVVIIFVDFCFVMSCILSKVEQCFDICSITTTRFNLTEVFRRLNLIVYIILGSKL